MAEYNTRWISKLYYRKFPYKVKVYLPGVSYLRYKPTIRDLLRTYFKFESKHTPGKPADMSSQVWPDSLEISFLTNFKDITRFYKFYKKLCKLHPDQLHIRIEEPGANLYFTNEVTALIFLREFEELASDYYMPRSKDVLKFIKNIEKYQICVEVLPHNGYIYKVHIDPRNINKLSNSRRRGFKTWIDMINLNSQKIKLTTSLNDFLEETNSRWYCNETHFHVKDEEHLAICYLYLGDMVKSVDEFVLYRETKSA